MPNVDEIVTRDLSSGRFHKRIRYEGRIYTLEGCNLDQAGEYEILPKSGTSRGIDNRGVPVGTDDSLLCQNHEW
jgi:hypothetical protein